MSNPRSAKRQRVRNRIKREAYANRRIKAPPPLPAAPPPPQPFAVGDAVRHGGRRGVVAAIRPGEVSIRGIIGWVPIAEVEIEEDA